MLADLQALNALIVLHTLMLNGEHFYYVSQAASGSKVMMFNLTSKQITEVFQLPKSSVVTDIGVNDQSQPYVIYDRQGGDQSRIVLLAESQDLK